MKTTPPYLLSLKREDIAKFLDDYDEYERNLTLEGCDTVSIISCISLQLLDTIISLGEFDSTAKIPDDLKPHEVRDWLIVLIYFPNPVPRSTVEEFITMHLRMDLTEVNPALRVVNLFADFTMLLKSKGWERITSKDKEFAVSLIIQKLKPDSLRDEVSRALTHERRDLKSNWAMFFQFVKETSTAPPYC